MKISDAVKSLVGLYFFCAERQKNNITIFRFGKFRKSSGKMKCHQFDAVIAIHAENSWRLTGREKILAASLDKYFPPNLKNHEDHLEWSFQKKNRMEILLKRFFKKFKKKPLVVSQADLSPFGDLIIKFPNGIVFSIIVSSSVKMESWRFIYSGEKKNYTFIIPKNHV